MASKGVEDRDSKRVKKERKKSGKDLKEEKKLQAERAAKERKEQGVKKRLNAKKRKEAQKKLRDEQAQKRREMREEIMLAREKKFEAFCKKYRDRITKITSKSGITQIFVKGKSAHRVLVEIAKEDTLFDVQKSEDGVSFCTRSKHCGKILAKLNKLCYDYKIVKVSGGASRIFFALSRMGLILGTIVVLVAMAIYPCFITRVSVGGYNAPNVQEVLAKYGVVQGNFLPSLDTVSLQNELRKLSGVAYASVIREGAHVSVNLKGELDGEHFVEVSGSKVVATRRAVVTRVVVHSGTAVKKYGDIVQKGDCVIDGFVTYGDERIEIEAQGYAYGKVYLRKSIFFADEQLLQTRKESKTIVKLAYANKVPSTPASPFESYELTTRVSKLGFLLPLSVWEFEFVKLESETVQNNLSKEQMIARVYTDILAQVDSACTVLDVYSDVRRVEGGYNCCVTIEAEVKIA